MRAVLLWSALSVAVVACASDLDPHGEGLPCTASGACAAGYVCDPVGQRCVEPSALEAGLPEDAPLPVPDASVDQETNDVVVVETDADCDAPVLYYQDADGDGFGTSDVVASFCLPPRAGYSEVAGDCNDAVAEAFPGQTQFFPTGYSIAGGGTSFDYDCSGDELPDDSQAGEAPDCGTLSGCTGEGFVPTPRSGDGVDPLCGSTAFVECKTELLTCKSDVSTASEPKRCR